MNQLAGFWVKLGLEAILGPVGLIGNDDDIAPIREQWVTIATFVGRELLRMVVNATPPANLRSSRRRSPRSAACTGDWRGNSAQRAKVQSTPWIIAVGDDHKRRVFHRRRLDDGRVEAMVRLPEARRYARQHRRADHSRG